jgi:hypothetical protein
MMHSLLAGGGRRGALRNTWSPDSILRRRRALASGRRARARRAGERGAVFVEALVAAAIVAMVMAVTLQVVSNGFSQERMVASRRMALLVAQSQMAQVGFSIPTAPGENAGFDGPFLWRVTVSSYDSAGGPNTTGALMKVLVTVRARSGGGDLARLETLRLGAG